MRRHQASLLIAALLLSLLPSAALAQSAPDPTDGPDRGPEAVETGTMRDPAAPPAEQFATPLSRGEAQARTFAAVDCPLSIYPEDPADVSLAIGVVPYHDIAPRLCAADDSERVSLEVAGVSVQGREMPLAVVTAPESEEQAARNDELTRLMVEDPEAAAALLAGGGYDDYKPALMHNGNIHGNEWEGTDYSLDVIDYLAAADDDDPIVEDTTGMSPEQIAALPTVGEVLSEFRLVFLLTANPDGRAMGRRQNDRFIDMNRDHLTQSQPETVVMRDEMIRHQPLLFQDHHGYVNNPGRGLHGLIEPTTPPHGEAYEYDLYLPSALRLALDAEADILRRRDAGQLSLFVEDNVRIPYRDDEEGWDDWPPIFTPMYAMYHGIVGATIEFPFNPRPTDLADGVRAERVQNNITFGRAVVDTMHVNGFEHRDTLLANQLEYYRRGAAGEPSPYETQPDEAFDPILGLWDDEHRYPTTYPRAYVIPVGEDQASDVAAARLAQHLLDNDIEVSVLGEDTEIDGDTYAADSYVVDMHQAKRGLAHTMLGAGTDISERVDAMYDISGWSLGLLWGADVAAVDDDGFTAALEAIDAAWRQGEVEGGAALGYALTLTSADEIAALSALWDAGVPL
jgi:hypothetical protein